MVEKKFSVGPVPSATVGKAYADGLLAFAESFRLSAKPGFPVVTCSDSKSRRRQITNNYHVER
jgi:hypothetical protein